METEDTEPETSENGESDDEIVDDVTTVTAAELTGVNEETAETSNTGDSEPDTAEPESGTPEPSEPETDTPEPSDSVGDNSGDYSAETIAGTLTYSDSDIEPLTPGMSVNKIQSPTGDFAALTIDDGDRLINYAGKSFVVDPNENKGYLVIEP